MVKAVSVPIMVLMSMSQSVIFVDTFFGWAGEKVFLKEVRQETKTVFCGIPKTCYMHATKPG